MYSPKQAIAAIALLTVVSSAQSSTSQPYNAPITYNALSPNTTVSGTYTQTIYYTTTSLFGSFQTITVGEYLPGPASGVTTTTCPPNFVEFGGPRCMYCPHPGFYNYRGACATSTLIPAECAFGYYPGGTATSGGIYTYNPCVPSTVPVIPECPGGARTISGGCVYPSVAPSITSYTRTLSASNGEPPETLYTLVYPPGVNASTIGGTFTFWPGGKYTGPVTTITTDGVTLTEAPGVLPSQYSSLTSASAATSSSSITGSLMTSSVGTFVQTSATASVSSYKGEAGRFGVDATLMMWFVLAGGAGAAMVLV